MSFISRLERVNWQEYDTLKLDDETQRVRECVEIKGVLLGRDE